MMSHLCSSELNVSVLFISLKCLFTPPKLKVYVFSWKWTLMDLFSKHLLSAYPSTALVCLRQLCHCLHLNPWFQNGGIKYEGRIIVVYALGLPVAQWDQILMMQERLEKYNMK